MRSIAGCLLLLCTVAALPAGAQFDWRLYNEEGKVAFAKQDWAHAEASWKKAIAEAEKANPNDPRAALTYRNLGTLYENTQRLSDAQDAFKHAVDIARASLGAGAPETVAAESDYQQCLALQGQSSTAAETPARPVQKPAAAATKQTESAPASQASAPQAGGSAEDARDAWVEAWKQGVQAYKSKHYDEAEGQWRKALEIAPRINDKATAHSLNALLTALYAQNKYKDAEPIYKRALDIVARKCGSDSLAYARSLTGYEKLLEKLGKKKQARALAKKNAKVQKRYATVSSSYPDTSYSPAKVDTADGDIKDDDVSALVPPSYDSQIRTDDDDNAKESKQGFKFPQPHAPNLIRLISALIGSLVAFKSALKLGFKYAVKVIPDNLPSTDKKKIGNLKLLCNSTVVWWLFPVAGVVGALLCRQFASSYKPTARKYRNFSSFVFTMSVSMWIIGIFYACFFK